MLLHPSDPTGIPGPMQMNPSPLSALRAFSSLFQHLQNFTVSQEHKSTNHTPSVWIASSPSSWITFCSACASLLLPFLPLLSAFQRSWRVFTPTAGVRKRVPHLKLEWIITYQEKNDQILREKDSFIPVSSAPTPPSSTFSATNKRLPLMLIMSV